MKTLTPAQFKSRRAALIDAILRAKSQNIPLQELAADLLVRLSLIHHAAKQAGGPENLDLVHKIDAAMPLLNELISAEAPDDEP